MDFQLSSKKRLNSSQGNPYEANEERSSADQSQRGLVAVRFCQRRKRHETGNSSIYFLTILAAGLLATSTFAQGTPSPEQAAKIRQVGDDFEAMMLQRLQEDMEKSQGLLQVGDDNPFAPSNAEQIYRSMMTQAMMQNLARRRPLGVGNLVERQLRGEGGIGPRALVKSSDGLEDGNAITAKPESQPGSAPEADSSGG